MIKSIKQYISDLGLQLSHSDMDDFIWIYLPFSILMACIAFILSLIISIIL